MNESAETESVVWQRRDEADSLSKSSAACTSLKSDRRDFGSVVVEIPKCQIVSLDGKSLQARNNLLPIRVATGKCVTGTLRVYQLSA